MTREIITGNDLPRPLGPYSPAVKVGNLLFLSAQTGVDPATGQLPNGGFEAEVRQAISNITTVLAAAGAGPANLVKLTVLYDDLDNLKTINAVFTEAFPTDPPARTAAIVGLAGGRHISIDAIAEIPM